MHIKLPRVKRKTNKNAESAVETMRKRSESDFEESILFIGATEDTAVFGDQSALYFFQDQIKEERVFFVVDDSALNGFTETPAASPRRKDSEKVSEGGDVEEEETKSNADPPLHIVKSTASSKKLTWASGKKAFFIA